MSKGSRIVRLIVFVEKKEKERIARPSSLFGILARIFATRRRGELVDIRIYRRLAPSIPSHSSVYHNCRQSREAMHRFFDPSSGVSCSRGVFHALSSPPNFPSKVTARIGRLCVHAALGSTSTSSILFPRFSELIEKLSACLLLEHRVKTDLLSRLRKLEYPLSLSLSPQLNRLSNFDYHFRDYSAGVGLLLIYLE